MKKKKQNKDVTTKVIRPVEKKPVPDSQVRTIAAKCEVLVTIQDKQFKMELDTGSPGNFISVPVWKQLGKPKLTDAPCNYKSATDHPVPVMGIFTGITENPATGIKADVEYTVTTMPDLNILGRNAIFSLGISLDSALQQHWISRL